MREIKVKKGVYIIRNTKTKYVYIGSSLDVKARVYDHFVELKAGTHGNYKMQKAYNRYKKYFVWGMLKEFKEDWIDREVIYDSEQYFLDTIEKQYNILRDARAHLIENKEERLAQNKKHKQRKLKL